MSISKTVTEPSGIITLVTDFGYADEYVGVVKGMLLKHFAEATIVDICHSVARQDVTHAARMVEASFAYFPDGTVHLVVVDPGVGTKRSILIIETRDHLFVGPDNGVFTRLLQAESGCRCWRLPGNTKDEVSATFHGRDIMAPAAARLAAGVSPEELGSPVAAKECIMVPLASARIDNNRIIGEVTGFDHFGNIATSIDAESLSHMGGNIRISIAGTTITSLSRTYADVPRHQLLALIDSRGYLEIGMNQGDAAEYLACYRGDEVVVTAGKTA